MKYRLGHTYVDKGKKTHNADEFLRWINIEGSGMLNSPGIRPLRYTSVLLESGLPAYLILITNDVTSGQQNPWDDVVDLSSADILYWGDAKFDAVKRIDDFNGNSVLRKVYNYILSDESELVPPILHFSKPKSGQVQFNGLCALKKLEVSWFDDHGKPVQNYHAHLTILDCEEVSIDWLHHRVASSGPKTLDNHSDCPESWRQYKKGRTKPIDIWFKKIRTTDQQLPPLDSEDNKVLSKLVALDPFHFERVVVSLFQQMSEITHHIVGTQAIADGGFDFHGTFKLPRPVAYEIPFRGEVKRFARSTAVDPKSVSRLVARLNRNEYGIFVTTSYFTRQAQQEVLSDGYPVHLISGVDLLLMLKHQRLIRNGTIDSGWLETISMESV